MTADKEFHASSMRRPTSRTSGRWSAAAGAHIDRLRDATTRRTTGKAQDIVGTPMIAKPSAPANPKRRQKHLRTNLSARSANRPDQGALSGISEQ